MEIPGRGSSSPVIWGDRLFVLSAVPIGVDRRRVARAARRDPAARRYRFVVLALDRRTGRRSGSASRAKRQPHEATHQDNGTYASSSAITDGQRVYAWFESQGMYVYDMDGKLLWSKDLGDKTMRNQFGEGSTPVLAGDRLVIVWDHLGGSFVVALDARERTRAVAPSRATRSTPGRRRSSSSRADAARRSCRARTRSAATTSRPATIVWESKGVTMNPIPSPVFGDGMVFVTSGFQGNNLKAIRLAGAKGDITGTEAIVWTLDRDTPYVPSPLLYDGILYLLKTNSGMLSAFDATTRQAALPAAAARGDARSVRVAGRRGRPRLHRGPRRRRRSSSATGRAYEVLASNKLDDGFDASPALVDDAIYLRGYRNLYCIAAPALTAALRKNR